MTDNGPIDPRAYSAIVMGWAEKHLAERGIPPETAAAQMLLAALLRLVKIIGAENTRAYVQSNLTDEALATAIKINEANEIAADRPAIKGADLR